MIHESAHPYAGLTVRLKDGEEYRVEDWADRVYGKSIWAANGNPAALKYAIHVADKNLPIDNEVLYGKVGYFGRLVHTSEIETRRPTP